MSPLGLSWGKACRPQVMRFRRGQWLLVQSRPESLPGCEPPAASLRLQEDLARRAVARKWVASAEAVRSHCSVLAASAFSFSLWRCPVFSFLGPGSFDAEQASARLAEVVRICSVLWSGLVGFWYGPGFGSCYGQGSGSCDSG